MLLAGVAGRRITELVFYPTAVRYVILKSIMAFDFARDCWFLVGPTASGKTVVGLALARLLQAEIVSLDSMALYRGMDIGTAKPTAEQRREIPHHLLDILEPHEEYSVAQYLAAAENCVRDIHRRGRKALFVGGTPLYVKALLRGLFRGPPADWRLRHELAEKAVRHGNRRLHEQLAAVDPLAAARLHPNDTRRIIRALEVFYLTGRPISRWQEQFTVGRAAEECRVLVLAWPKEQLHARIHQRVKEMFAAGLVEETRRLLAGKSPLSRTASQAVGYREVIAHLSGKYSLEETMELVCRRTRRLAKHQMTWYRSLSECRFLNLNEPLDPLDTAARIIKLSG